MDNGQKLRKLGKIELLELVQELMEELDTLRLQQDMHSLRDMVEAKVPQQQGSAPPTPPSAYEDADPTVEQMERFSRSIREVCDDALRIQQELEGAIGRLRQEGRQREEETEQMLQAAVGKTQDVLNTLLGYKANMKRHYTG